jgi:hypothetical protein
MVAERRLWFGGRVRVCHKGVQTCDSRINLIRLYLSVSNNPQSRLTYCSKCGFVCGRYMVLAAFSRFTSLSSIWQGTTSCGETTTTIPHATSSAAITPSSYNQFAPHPFPGCSTSPPSERPTSILPFLAHLSVACCKVGVAGRSPLGQHSGLKMSNQFIGLTMLVTLSSPPGAQLRGVVSSVEPGKSLTLRHGTKPANPRY